LNLAVIELFISPCYEGTICMNTSKINKSYKQVFYI